MVKRGKVRSPFWQEGFLPISSVPPYSNQGNILSG